MHYQLLQEPPSTESSVRYSYTPIAKAKCPSNCVDRTEFIQATKEQIRKEILRKLNLNAPPNVTSNDAPKHLIEQLKRKYDLDENEMGQSDQPELMEEDDFHFQTREISILAQNGKYLFLVVFPLALFIKNRKELFCKSSST